jgi:hypothetical protein
MLLSLSAGPGLAQPQTLAGTASGSPKGAAAPTGKDPISAQAAPSVSIAAPSAAIGDFGASQDNVWDMDSIETDIVWKQPNASGQTISLSQPSSGIVRGAVPEGNDLAIAFYTSSSTDLPSSDYHHLTYRLKIAAEGGCQTNGRIIYAKVWPNWLGSQVFTHAYSPELEPMSCPYGNFCVYYMDLSSNDNDGRSPYYDTWFKDPPPWPNDSVKAFGMWPHEQWYGSGCSGGPDYFYLDFVYLTGDIVARAKDGYKYTIKWNVSDPDGGTITSTIRYQEVPELLLPSDKPTCDSTNFMAEWANIAQTTTVLIPTPAYSNKIFLPIIMRETSGGMGPYNATYDWYLSDSNPDFEDGMSYYVCIKVDDGTSQSYAVSSAPVIRVPLSPNFGGG